MAKMTWQKTTWQSSAHPDNAQVEAAIGTDDVSVKKSSGFVRRLHCDY